MMIELFLYKDDYDNSRYITDPILERSMMQLGLSLEYLKDYYRRSSRVVKRPNMLIKYINMLDINPEDKEEDVRVAIISRGPYYLKQLGVTSTLSKGEKHFHTVLPVNEFFMSVAMDTDISYNNYYDYQSLRCVYHEIDSLLFKHPYNVDEEWLNVTYAVYELDPVALGLQYYYWCRDRLEQDLSIDIGKFLYEVPFTNMLETVNAISLINRFFSLYQNETVSDIIKDNRVSIALNAAKIDDHYVKLIKELKRHNKLSIMQFLKSIPVIYDNAYDYLLLNHWTRNLNTEWLLWFTRIKYIYSLLKINENILKHDSHLVNDLRNELYLLKRSGSLNNCPDEYVMVFLESYIKDIYTILKRRR